MKKVQNTNLSLREKVILGGVQNSEEDFLSNNGFIVKGALSFFDALKAYYYFLPFILPIVIIAILAGMDHIIFTITLFFIVGGYPLYKILSSQFLYIIAGLFFFTENKVVFLGKSYKSLQEIQQIDSIKDIKKMDPNVGHILLIFLFIGMLLGMGIYSSSEMVFMITIIIITLLGIPLFSLFLRQLVEHFHPLYAFGNLGEKIQKLTPEIEKQSQLIQSEFQKDMNFSVLHSGFEKLSGTFSKIIELVLKLERIESRANKGNLFDSQKYIGSLRADIITPLSELKKFLESQRKQLLESQKELSRVRVGGPDTTANIELQSKRSESLLQELDTNITALGTMIRKME